MIGTGLNLQAIPASNMRGNLRSDSRSRDVGSRARPSATPVADPFQQRSQDPFLDKTTDPFLEKTNDPFLTKKDSVAAAPSKPSTSAKRSTSARAVTPDTATARAAANTQAASSTSSAQATNEPHPDSFESSLDNSMATGHKWNEPVNSDLSVAYGNAAVPNTEDAKAEPQATLQNMVKVQTADRHAAMQVFLERMQSELGVDPERVVEAFSKLSNEDLMAPPEESSAKFIKLLGLPPTESKKALGLYNDMLAMVAATGMAQSLASKNMQANISVTDKEQEEIRQLRHSINDMSDRFFMTGRFGIQQRVNPSAVAQMYGHSAQALTDRMPNAQGENADAASALSNLSDEQKKTLGQEVVNSKGQVIANQGNAQAALSSAQLAALASQQAAANAAASAQAETAAASTESPESSEGILRKLVANAGAKQSATAGAQIAPQANAAQANAIEKNAAPAAATAASAGMVAAMGEKGAHNGTGADTDKNEKGDDLAYSQVQQQQDGGLKTQHGEKAFSLQTAKSPSHAEMQANIKEVISQAQFLSKRGGGEMKVKLNPDGLGEVNLKVKMQNGQVNVEMVASNDAAKKALEKGLNDLKQSLSTHKLNLESIRIDSSRDIGNQLSHQRQDLERGFQQRFLSDFEDRNGASRRELFEYPGPSIPSNQRNDPASNSGYVTNSKRRDSSRRLDLVA